MIEIKTIPEKQKRENHISPKRSGHIGSCTVCQDTLRSMGWKYTVSEEVKT